MPNIDIKEELESEEYKTESARNREIINDFISTLSFCYADTARDTQNSPKYFSLRMIDDFIQSSISIQLLAEQGIINQCRRECRYLLETAVKVCLVSQNQSNSDYETQIIIYSKLLRDTNISMINQATLSLTSDLKAEFISEVKKLYGKLNEYVHCTPTQLTEKLELAKKGRYIGYSGV